MDVALLIRLETLEKQNRRLRRLSTICFIMSFLLFALTICEYAGVEIIPTKAIYTRSLYLKDAQGRVSAELSSYPGMTLFSIYDPNGQPRVAFSLLNNEPGVHLYDRQGIRRAVLGINEVGPSMMFMTPSGVEISGLTTRCDGSTDLFLDELGAGHVKKPIDEQTAMTDKPQKDANLLRGQAY